MKAVYQWVLRTMMKAKGETGIVQTMPKKDLIEMNAQITAQRLMQNGVDPQSLKNADQVENAIISIENKQKANLAENIRGGIGNTKTAKVFNTAGEELDPSKPIIGGTQEGKKINQDFFIRDAEIKTRLEKQNKENVAKIRQRMVDEAIDNSSPGFAGDIKYDAQLVADDLAERMGKTFDDLSQKEQIDLYDQAYQGLSKQRFKNRKKPSDPDDQESSYDDGPADFDPDADNETFAKGGIARLGFKDGMNRRTFLKILGGMAAVPIVGKFFKLAKVGQTVKKVPMIKTGDVPGKPEWFDALINKVITEGDDVTKKFATKDREIVHMKVLDKGTGGKEFPPGNPGADDTSIMVTQDLDAGAIRVEYRNPENVYGDPVQLQYKKPLPDEGAPRPAAEFDTAESGPVGRATGPDDYEIELDEVGGTSISDLTSDVSKLKEYATGKKPTMKEIIQNKKRRDRAKNISEGGESEMDEVIRRQGEFIQFEDIDPNFASGGIARMLGE